MQRSGPGSQLLLGGPNRSFGTWNARSLFARRHAAAEADKRNYLLQLLAGASLLGVQETHGDLSDVSELAGKLSSHFIGWSSRAHSATFDSEKDFHVAGVAAELESENDEATAQSDESGSHKSEHSSEHAFLIMRKMGLRNVILFHKTRNLNHKCGAIFIIMAVA